MIVLIKQGGMQCRQSGRSDTHPAAWPPKCQALHSSTTGKLSDLTHACVPRCGIIKS